MLSCSPLISFSSSVCLSLSLSLALFLSLSLKENTCRFYIFLDISVEFNENYRNETRLEKWKPIVIVCLCVKGKHRKPYWNLWKGSLKLLSFPRKQEQNLEKDVFLSCYERGTKKKNSESPWGSNLRRSDSALRCFTIEPHYEVHMTRVLPRISNVDSVMFVDRNKRDGNLLSSKDS